MGQSNGNLFPTNVSQGDVLTAPPPIPQLIRTGEPHRFQPQRKAMGASQIHTDGKPTGKQRRKIQQIKRDILFLLAPGFEDKNRREYCPECAELWGVLSYFPAIKEAVEIRYQSIGRPRAAMVDLLGDENQN